MRSRLACLAFVACSAVVAAAGSCQQVESVDIRTSGIYANMSAVADVSGRTDLSATLRVGGALSNTYLELEGGDRLMAYMGAEAKLMEENESIVGTVSYATAFDEIAAETEFVIAFERTVADESAPDTSLVLPAPFTLTGPSAPASRAADDIVVTWAPSGTPDGMSWRLASNTCAHFELTPIGGDPGTVTIPQGRVLPVVGQETQPCAFTLEFTRSRDGLLDLAYGEGGTAVAHQVRRVTIDTVP